MGDLDINNGLNLPERSLKHIQDIKVLCAWCKKFLYHAEGTHKEKYNISHGICKDCAEKVFNIKDILE